MQSIHLLWQWIVQGDIMCADVLSLISNPAVLDYEKSLCTIVSTSSSEVDNWLSRNTPLNYLNSLQYTQDLYGLVPVDFTHTHHWYMIVQWSNYKENGCMNALITDDIMMTSSNGSFVRGIHQSSMNSPHKGSVIRTLTWCLFDVVGLYKLLNKQSNDRWFETTWRPCDVIIIITPKHSTAKSKSILMGYRAHGFVHWKDNPA